MNKWMWAVLYICSILVGNLFVNWLGIVKVAGITFPAGVVFIGLTFSLRDFVQRAWGDWPTWIWMGISSGITTLFNLDLALASFCAFIISEGVDWFVFRVFNLPFYKRIYISNLFSCPLDSVVFVTLAFGWFWPAIWGQALIKYVSGFILIPVAIYRARNKTEEGTFELHV